MAEQPASTVVTLSEADASHYDLLGEVMCDFFKYQSFTLTLLNLPLEEHLLFSLRYDSFLSFFFCEIPHAANRLPPKPSS